MDDARDDDQETAPTDDGAAAPSGPEPALPPWDLRPEPATSDGPPAPESTSESTSEGATTGAGTSEAAATPEPSPESEPALHVPFGPAWYTRAWAWLDRVTSRVRRHFYLQEPTTGRAFLVLVCLSLVLFTRLPTTNYIFDEQEALLANPYVNATQNLGFLDAFTRDFWGLPPTGSIGSYRPLPDILWRVLWTVTKEPFIHHLYNVILHGLNGALLGAFAYVLTRRRAVGWLAGVTFVSAALLTEAVSGIVGLADVLGGLGALAALHALRWPAWAMPIGVFLGVTIGLFSKESALVCVGLIPAAALVTAPFLHTRKPARWARALLATIAAAGAFAMYVELRKMWFPSPLPEEVRTHMEEKGTFTALLEHTEGRLGVGDEPNAVKDVFLDFKGWFHQPGLPVDWLNNPLAREGVDFPHRVAGAMRVYWRGLKDVVVPLRLSGDYSYPQEPVPDTLYGAETIAGAAMTVLPLLAAAWLALGAWWRERKERRTYAARLAAGAGAARLDPRASTRPEDLEHARYLPLPASRRQTGLLVAGLSLGALGAAGIAVALWLLGEGTPTPVPLWPFGVAVLTVGLGMLVEAPARRGIALYPVGVWPLARIAPAVVALGFVWMVLAYFPHSNIPEKLPTVRAERLWYFPVLGTTLIVAVALAWLFEVGAPERYRPGARWFLHPVRTLGRLVGLGLAKLAALWKLKRLGGRSGAVTLPVAVTALFLGFQMVQAYWHATDYRDDLVFWESTKDAVPNSAKAHLNFSVMKGARGDLETRLVHSQIALELAPEWTMAHIYTGDTLCRLGRPDEAWPYYVSGFEQGPNDRSLISLALQCLWDYQKVEPHKDELKDMARAHEGSWLAYLANDIVDNGKTHNGVDPKYRPRGYNEGPKE
ncbi:MAG: tetratricopeptide repeat protein [Myxococcales bacterium]|nr:tetratricopeptide repeat protein [Myxococcales bacterium]